MVCCEEDGLHSSFESHLSSSCLMRVGEVSLFREHSGRLCLLDSCLLGQGESEGKRGVLAVSLTGYAAPESV